MNLAWVSGGEALEWATLEVGMDGELTPLLGYLFLEKQIKLRSWCKVIINVPISDWIQQIMSTVAAGWLQGQQAGRSINCSQTAMRFRNFIPLTLHKILNKVCTPLHLEIGSSDHVNCKWWSMSVNSSLFDLGYLFHSIVGA